MTIAEAHARLTAPGAAFEIETTVIRGIPTRIWKNGPGTLRDVFLNGMRFKDRDFLVYESERVTFDSFGRAVLTLAHRLLADGVVKGDRVAVVMRNLPEWAVAFWAGQLVGAIVTPLNAWWTGAELAYGLENSGAKIALVDPERLERLGSTLDRLPELQTVYAARLGATPSHPKVSLLEDIIGEVEAWSRLPWLALPQVPLEPDDEATILYTSGTTGRPKGAVGTHRNITSNIQASALAATRTYLRKGEPFPELDPLRSSQRAILLVVPLFHVSGLAVLLTPALNAGSKLVLMHRWEPEAAMQLIERERVMQTGGVPTIIWNLIEHPALARYDLSSLTTLNYGGAGTSPELVRKIAEIFPRVVPGNGWGMTETSGIFTRHLGKDYDNRPESAGPAVPVGDMEIRGSDGRTVLPTGVVGELWVKGPQVVKRYWNMPDATAETFQDGWLRTGDLARIDEEGFLFIVDRAKDMLIRGGENIYCVEVENVLHQHPDVVEAALIGVPHKTLGEEPAAVVHLRPGSNATESELRELVRQKLAAFKVPVKVAFWPEPLPRNVGGKVIKAELRRVFASSPEHASSAAASDHESERR